MCAHYQIKWIFIKIRFLSGVAEYCQYSHPNFLIIFFFPFLSFFYFFINFIVVYLVLVCATTITKETFFFFFCSRKSYFFLFLYFFFSIYTSLSSFIYFFSLNLAQRSKYFLNFYWNAFKYWINHIFRQPFGNPITIVVKSYFW